MDVISLVIAGTGVGVWRWQAHRRRARRVAQLLANLDESAEVAIHVAKHEAEGRKQPLGALHILYGLLQDEAFTAAITSLEGIAATTPATIEEHVLAALDATGAERDPREGVMTLARACSLAELHDRRASTTDLWHFLRRTSAASAVEAAGVGTFALELALVHRGLQPATVLPGETAVHVVLRNDDYTSADFVVMVLREVFDVDAARAQTTTQTAHAQGKAIVGRFTSADARERLEKARSRAREHGFPLWLGVEVC